MDKMIKKQSFNKLLEELLSRGGECEWIEFKKNYCKPQDIGEYLSALGNSALLHDQSYGYLIFGVCDETLKITGTKFHFKKTKQGNEELENWLSRGLKPPTHFKALEFQYNDKKIFMFQVEASTGEPIAFYGKEFIRIGSYKKNLKLHPEKEEKIWSKKKFNKFELNLALENLDKDILEIIDYPKYFTSMKMPLPSEKDIILKRLEEDNLVKQLEHGGTGITNLGAILFARNLKSFNTIWRKSLRVVIYKGNNKLQPIREEEFSSGYVSGFNEAIRYIQGALPAKEEIQSGYRKEEKTYPETAIRELLANMLIHQDFSRTGTGPMVEIFHNRIEFSNPGDSLIPHRRFIDHKPESRNEILANIMRRMGICEERGIGIDTVVTAVEEYNLPAPSFLSEQNFFTAILYGPKEWNDMSEMEKREACYQHCCLKYVETTPMTFLSLKKRFNIKGSDNDSAVSEIILNAVDAKLIKPWPDANQYAPFWAG